MTFFEVWDTDSANVLEDSDTHDEAIEIVRSFLAIGDPEYLTSFAIDAV